MEADPRVMGVAVLLKDLESIKTVQSLVSSSAKLAALGRLTSGVAHEVKNPLNAMMIHVELLKERLEAADPDVRQSLEVIGSEIRRLDRVVQGFLKFMRPQELTLKPVDLNSMLQSVGALLEAEGKSLGVRFILDLDAGLPSVSADEELLRQAFINIVQNAVQAMPGGGAGRIRTRPEGLERARGRWAGAPGRPRAGPPRGAGERFRGPAKPAPPTAQPPAPPAPAAPVPVPPPPRTAAIPREPNLPAPVLAPQASAEEEQRIKSQAERRIEGTARLGQKIDPSRLGRGQRANHLSLPSFP